MDDLSKRRWKIDQKPQSHAVESALEMALERLREGTLKADHIIVCTGHVDEALSVRTEFFQAGNFSPYAQAGLLDLVKTMLKE